MGEVISMSDYLERKSKSAPESIQRRIAAISLEILLLQSEKTQLEKQLLGGAE